MNSQCDIYYQLIESTASKLVKTCDHVTLHHQEFALLTNKILEIVRKLKQQIELGLETELNETQLQGILSRLQSLTHLANYLQSHPQLIKKLLTVVTSSISWLKDLKSAQEKAGLDKQLVQDFAVELKASRRQFRSLFRQNLDSEGIDKVVQGIFHFARKLQAQILAIHQMRLVTFNAEFAKRKQALDKLANKYQLTIDFTEKKPVDGIVDNIIALSERIISEAPDFELAHYQQGLKLIESHREACEAFISQACGQINERLADDIIYFTELRAELKARYLNLFSQECYRSFFDFDAGVEQSDEPPFEQLKRVIRRRNEKIRLLKEAELDFIEMMMTRLTTLKTFYQSVMSDIAERSMTSISMPGRINELLDQLKSQQALYQTDKKPNHVEFQRLVSSYTTVSDSVSQSCYPAFLTFINGSKAALRELEAFFTAFKLDVPQLGQLKLLLDSVIPLTSFDSTSVAVTQYIESIHAELDQGLTELLAIKSDFIAKRVAKMQHLLEQGIVKKLGKQRFMLLADTLTESLQRLQSQDWSSIDDELMMRCFKSETLSLRKEIMALDISDYPLLKARRLINRYLYLKAVAHECNTPLSGTGLDTLERLAKLGERSSLRAALSLRDWQSLFTAYKSLRQHFPVDKKAPSVLEPTRELNEPQFRQYIKTFQQRVERYQNESNRLYQRMAELIEWDESGFHLTSRNSRILIRTFVKVKPQLNRLSKEYQRSLALLKGFYNSEASFVEPQKAKEHFHFLLGHVEKLHLALANVYDAFVQEVVSQISQRHHDLFKQYQLLRKQQHTFIKCIPSHEGHDEVAILHEVLKLKHQHDQIEAARIQCIQNIDKRTNPIDRELLVHQAQKNALTDYKAFLKLYAHEVDVKVKKKRSERSASLTLRLVDGDYRMEKQRRLPIDAFPQLEETLLVYRQEQRKLARARLKEKLTKLKLAKERFQARFYHTRHKPLEESAVKDIIDGFDKPLSQYYLTIGHFIDEFNTESLDEQTTSEAIRRQQGELLATIHRHMTKVNTCEARFRGFFQREASGILVGYGLLKEDMPPFIQEIVQNQKERHTEALVIQDRHRDIIEANLRFDNLKNSHMQLAWFRYLLNLPCFIKVLKLYNTLSQKLADLERECEGLDREDRRVTLLRSLKEDFKAALKHYLNSDRTSRSSRLVHSVQAILARSLLKEARMTIFSAATEDNSWGQGFIEILQWLRDVIIVPLTDLASKFYTRDKYDSFLFASKHETEMAEVIRPVGKICRVEEDDFANFRQKYFSPVIACS